MRDLSIDTDSSQSHTRTMPSYQIVRGGNKTGLFEEAEVRAKPADGSIAALDLCWTEGMETWLPVSQVFEVDLQQQHLQRPPDPVSRLAESNRKVYCSLRHTWRRRSWQPFSAVCLLELSRSSMPPKCLPSIRQGIITASWNLLTRPSNGGTCRFWPCFGSSLQFSYVNTS